VEDPSRAKPEEDWSLFERGMAEHWANVRREGGAARVFEVAAALHDHVKTLRPDWPSERERELDLEHHRKLIAMLDRVRVRDR
jgi:hypothetical protein